MWVLKSPEPPRFAMASPARTTCTTIAATKSTAAAACNRTSAMGRLLLSPVGILTDRSSPRRRFHLLPSGAVGPPRDIGDDQIADDAASVGGGDACGLQDPQERPERARVNQRPDRGHGLGIA